MVGCRTRLGCTRDRSIHTQFQRLTQNPTTPWVPRPTIARRSTIELAKLQRPKRPSVGFLQCYLWVQSTSQFQQLGRKLKTSLMAQNPFLNDNRSSASFHPSTAKLCAHSVICTTNTHIPSHLDSHNPTPRDRGRCECGKSFRYFRKSKTRMVAHTQAEISQREIIEIDRARVTRDLLTSYDTMILRANP